MTVRVGINGFGRMGRLGVRAGWGRKDLAIVRVNEIATDAAGSAHLLKFDSVHGTWPVDCEAEGETMIVGIAGKAASGKTTVPISRPSTTALRSRTSTHARCISTTISPGAGPSAGSTSRAATSLTRATAPWRPRAAPGSPRLLAVVWAC